MHKNLAHYTQGYEIAKYSELPRRAMEATITHNNTAILRATNTGHGKPNTYTQLDTTQPHLANFTKFAQQYFPHEAADRMLDALIDLKEIYTISQQTNIPLDILADGLITKLNNEYAKHNMQLETGHHEFITETVNAITANNTPK